MEQIHGGDVYRHPGVLDYSANINPLGTSPLAVQAIREAADQVVHYPDVSCGELRKRIAEYEGVSEQQIFIGNGAAEVIFALIYAMRPKKVLFPVPTFLEYERALEGAGGTAVHYELREEDGFRLDEHFLEALTGDIDMCFLCNPNNPTGAMIEHGLMEKITDKCHEKGILLVVDECFLDFTDREEETVKKYLGSGVKLVVLKAFTKMYGLAGVRLGYGICSDGEVRAQMERMVQPWSVSVLAQAAGCAALGDTEHVINGKKIVREQREVLVSALTECGYQVFASEANYVFFRGREDLYERMLAGGFLIRDCSNYPGLGKGYYRIAVKGEEENRRFIAWLKQL